MGETASAPLPTAVYGGVLLLRGDRLHDPQRVIIRAQGPHSKLKDAVGGDTKGMISLALYAPAILLDARAPRDRLGVLRARRAIWLVPDRRIERVL